MFRRDLYGTSVKSIWAPNGSEVLYKQDQNHVSRFLDVVMILENTMPITSQKDKRAISHDDCAAVCPSWDSDFGLERNKQGLLGCLVAFGDNSNASHYQEEGGQALFC